MYLSVHEPSPKHERIANRAGSRRAVECLKPVGKAAMAITAKANDAVAICANCDVIIFGRAKVRTGRGVCECVFVNDGQTLKDRNNIAIDQKVGVLAVFCNLS